LKDFKYLIVGIGFGIVFLKAEIISWYRIQEMFRFQSFHMFGVIGSAILVGMIAMFMIKKFDIKTINGETIKPNKKIFHKGYVIGSFLFGIGWAMTGACPGPLFAQIGSGVYVVIVTLICALAGAWTYGLVKDRLPH
jgi:uncharacterized protein